jgi:2-oxoglutarate ferredoxin oxidoreductase subunit alpha
VAFNSHNGNGTRARQDLAWRIGGAQGSGVDTAALIFQRACGIAGLHLYGRREYYSNIMGRHSYYDVRVSEVPRTGHRDTVDLLTTFEAETLARHILAVREGGGLVHTAADANVALTDITFLDRRFTNDLSAYLEERELPATIAGLLEDARNRGVQCFAVNFDDIVTQLAERLEIPQAVAARTRNTLAVAISTALLNFRRDFVKKALERTWPGRQKIIDLNTEAVELTYNYVDEQFDRSDFSIDLDPAETTEKRMTLNGNQAVALGKLAGGVAVQSYYPISPATDESTFLEAHEEFGTRDGGTTNVLVVQTEDEISAITMATGAALTGARASTATSGPGFALMCEGLGWACINEVPLVITLWQRGGPSTGMPTRNEQGDLRIATAGAHGDFPLMVLASGDIIEAFYDAAECFNYADRYQTVVVHIVDKALSSASRTLPYFDLDQVTIDRGNVAEPRGESDGVAFPRFEVTESGVSPRTLLGQPGNAHWMTGGEHTPQGRVTEDPVVREEQIEKRARKMDLAAREIPLEEKIKIFGDRQAQLTILSWGSNKGAILETLDLLEDRGVEARFVQARLMMPFPADEFSELLENAAPLVIVESNFSGQFAQLLRQHTGIQPDHLIVKYNGRPISAEELIVAIDEIRAGEATARVVLRNPLQ